MYEEIVEVVSQSLSKRQLVLSKSLPLISDGRHSVQSCNVEIISSAPSYFTLLTYNASILNNISLITFHGPVS